MTFCWFCKLHTKRTPAGSAGVPVCRKSFAFSQTVSLFQMEKRASPLFQAFFPLRPRFFLNQAAVFRQSQTPAGSAGVLLRQREKRSVPGFQAAFVPVLFGGDAGNLPELLDKVALGRKGQLVGNLDHGTVAEPQQVFGHLDLLLADVGRH